MKNAPTAWSQKKVRLRVSYKLKRINIFLKIIVVHMRLI